MFKLRVAFGNGLAELEDPGLKGLELAARRDPYGSLDALIILELELQGGRRVRLVIRQRDRR